MIENNFENMDALLARFVAGTLPKPVEVLVASHLELSADSRAMVRAMEAAAGEMLEAEVPAALLSRDARLQAILASADVSDGAKGRMTPSCPVLPRALQDFIGHTVETIPWKTRLPGYKEYELGEIDGCQASMMWIRAGRKMPSHTHEGMELTLVVDGAFADIHGRFGRGDISVADESTDHRPIADPHKACIAFAVTDGGLRLTGPLHRRIADIFGAG